MRLSKFHIFIFFNCIMLISLGCSKTKQKEKSFDGSFCYVYSPTAIINGYIIVNSSKVPVLFDEGSSDREALNSLESLSALVTRANYKESHIYVVGKYFPHNKRLQLKDWYIKRPFIKYTSFYEVKGPNEVGGPVVKTLHLKRSDFHKNEQFNPNSASFNPDRYVKD